MVRRRILALLIWAVSFGSGIAHAGGSLPLIEVIAEFSSEPELTAEIVFAAERAGLRVDEVICTGNRFGRHWAHLGGARTAPFRCQLGTIELVIDAEIEYLDDAELVLSDEADQVAHAVDVRYRNVVWSWLQ